MIVFDASALVGAALKVDSIPERALLRAEEVDVFALSPAVCIGSLVHARPRRANIKARSNIRRKKSGLTIADDDCSGSLRAREPLGNSLDLHPVLTVSVAPEPRGSGDYSVLRCRA